MAVSQQLATQADSKGFLVFKDWETMDTQQERWGLQPGRPAWIENLQILARNKLRCVPGPAAAIATIAADSIYRKFYASYGGNDFLIEFGTSGAGYQVNLATGFVTQIAPAGTFSNPDVTTWKQQRVLIADPSAGYCTWDGSLLVQSGGVSPNITVTAGGSGYNPPPTVVISGGSGFGATAIAKTINGSVISIQLTNPGQHYKAGDVLTVTITGSGSGASATAVVFPTFSGPFTTLAVAFGRVWLGGGIILQWTGTNGFDDANTANAAGFTAITDADLVHQITALRNLNNFLYIFGDNSIKQIGNITVSGSATVFAITTLSSDTGTVFPRSIQSYNRVVTFANWEGVWQLFGATVTKISDEMDSVFDLIDFTLDPQAFVCTVNSQRVYGLLVRYRDPLLGPRSIMLARQGKRWFVVSQGTNVQAVATAVLNGRLAPYASSGTDVTPILASAVSAVAVILRTALDAQNKEMVSKRPLRIGIVQFAVASGTLNLTTDSENASVPQSYTFGPAIIWLNASQGQVTWLNNSAGVVTWVGSGFVFEEGQANASGIYLGCSLSGSVTGVRIAAIVIEYEDGPFMRSRNK